MRRVPEGRDYYAPPAEELFHEADIHPSPHAIKVGGGYDILEDPGVTTASRYRSSLSATSPAMSSYDRKLPASGLRYRGSGAAVGAPLRITDEPNPSDLTFQRLHHAVHAPRHGSIDAHEGYSREVYTAPLTLSYDYSREVAALPPVRKDYGTTSDPLTVPRGPVLTYDRVVEVPPYAGRTSAVSTVPSRALVRTGSPARPARKKLPLVPRVALLASKPASQLSKDVPKTVPVPAHPSTKAVVPVHDDYYIPPYERYVDRNTERFSEKYSSKASAADKCDIVPSTLGPYRRDRYEGAPTSQPADRGSGKYGSHGSRPSDRYSGDLSDSDVYGGSHPAKPGGKFVSTLDTYNSKYGDEYPVREDALDKYRPSADVADVDGDGDSDLEEIDPTRRQRPKYHDYDVDDDDRFDPRLEDHPVAGTLEDDYDDRYRPTKPYQPPTVSTSASAQRPAGGMVRYIVLGLGALVALYVLTKALSWFRGRPGGRINCGSYEYAACKDQGCSYDPELHSCFLPSPHEIVRESGFKAPYRFLFVGHSSAETRTCINSMARAYGSGKALGRPFDSRDYYTSTSLDQLHLYDTPPMDLTTDIDAFYKVRKFVGGVEQGQNFTRHPFAWVNDKSHAASRVVLVLDIRPAVKGWVWHSVKHSGIAFFTAQLEKVDTALPVSPLVLINTMGYKPKTANKIRDALKRAYRLDHSSVFNIDCSYVSPLDLSKVLYSVFLDNKYTSMRLESFAL